MRGEKGAQSVVVELPAVVSLEASNRAAELCVNVCMKTNQSGKNIRLVAQGECPNKMSIIIKNH
jgi:hypothetical protein